jgi:hypothetical protein
LVLLLYEHLAVWIALPVVVTFFTIGYVAVAGGVLSAVSQLTTTTESQP